MTAIAAALTVGAGAASARDLAAVDALASMPVVSSGASHLVHGKLQAFGGHASERLGVPSLLTASPATPKLAGAMQVSSNPAGVARGYLKHYADLYKITPAEIDALSVSKVQRLSSGATLVRFDHIVNGVEVFRERTAVMLAADGTLTGIGGSLAGAGPTASIDKASLFKTTAADALGRALADFGGDAAALRGSLSLSGDRDGYEFYTLASGSGVAMTEPARVKPVFFRLPSGLVPAYYLEVQVADAGNPNDYYSYVISAKDGSVLFRHNLVQNATAYTYRVWAETGAPNLPYPGPQGRNGTPHPTATPDGYQGPFIAPNAISLINAIQSPASAAINDPWLPDGATETVGNNVEAWANLYIAPTGDYYEPGNGDLRPDVTAANTFDRVYNTSLAPQVSPDQIKAATTQLFYMNNWLHDWYYDNGFDEAAGNAQADNYGRGGAGSDSIKAQAQDASGRNNANMATPADGARPRMRMYVFDGNSASHLVASGNLTGEYATGVAAGFGAQSFNLTQSVVLANDGSTAGGGTTTDGCQAFVNAAAVAGNIAVVDRGVCAFSIKAKNAQNAGAAGVIIANNQPGPAPGLGGTDATVTIPVLSLSQADGAALKSALTAAVTTQMERAKGVDRDGTIDDAIIAHEWGHYISNRLVQNSSGLSTNQSGGMGEGFGDFHALLMMVKAEDALAAANPNFAGVYAEAGYTSGGPSFAVNPNQGFYFGIRRYPYSTNFVKNPLTLKYVENGVALPLNPLPAFGQNGASNSEVHNTGEVWASALWECYAGLLRDSGRLTFAEAQDRMKSYMVAGYQLMPPAPTFMEARDAILAAAKANDATDFQVCAAGFARRGFGAGAQPPTDRYGSDNAGVVESFTTGPVAEWVSADLTDTPTSCDSDGVLDNGETGTLTLQLRNTGFQALFGTTVTLSSPDATVSFPQPTVTFPGIDTLQTGTITVPVQLSGAAGTPVITVDLSASSPSLAAPVNAQAQFRVNSDDQAAASTMDTFEAEHTFPWTTSISGVPDLPANYWSRIAVDGDPANHSAYGPDIGSDGTTAITTPALVVSATNPFSVTFQHRYVFEYGGSAYYDGGVIEISEDNGATWQDVTAAGGTLTPAYNGTIATGGNNPLEARNAYVKYNPQVAIDGGFDTVTLDFGTSKAGKTVQLRFVIGSDVGVGSYGWEIDNFAVSGIDNTPFPLLITDPNHCVLNDTIFGNGFE